MRRRSSRESVVKKLTLVHRAVAVVAVVCAPALLAPSRVSAEQPSTARAARESDAWPREAKSPRGTVLMYQPQIERLSQNDVEARAAVQVIPTGQEPVFGAVWISAEVDVDRDARLVTFRNVRIPRVRVVDASEADTTALARMLEQEIARWNLEMDLDRFIPLLDLAEHDNPADPRLKHDPPRIIIASEPTMLVVLDGPARRQALTTPKEAAAQKLERVVNTPALIVYHPEQKQYYLAGGGDLWYAGTDVRGPYAPAKRVPPAIAALAPTPDATEAKGTEMPPKVSVATDPTELIVVAGRPQYAAMGEVDLLAVSNADADIIVTSGTRAHYVLLSGRWYVSRNELQGPWTFVPPGELPANFARIPEESNYAHVRAHVPGTVEAREALLDNTIPQTQAVRRDAPSLKIAYDGTPVFKDVESTSIQYAANTPQAVFKVSNRYYACEQAVWYEAVSPTGPWTVSTSVPKEIYGIPASNPHHNVTYVKVYDVTPQIVYVGYTPAYLGSYPYGGCIVYGTGWHYPGWYGSVYYPGPATWGFRAVYNPYYGWGFGISWSSGPLTVSVGFGGSPWGYPGWWGPWGYRPYYPPYRPPYYPGYRPPYYPGYHPPGYPGYRPPAVQPLPGTPAQLPAGRIGAQPADRSIYRKGDNAARNAPSLGPAAPTRPVPANRPNDVFSAPSGDVFRRTPSGDWERREGGKWTPSPGAAAAAAPSTPSVAPSRPGGAGGTPSTQPTRPPDGLNRDYGARERGAGRSGAAPRPTPRGGGRRG
jgi:hypothetical protein